MRFRIRNRFQKLRRAAREYRIQLVLTNAIVFTALVVFELGIIFPPSPTHGAPFVIERGLDAQKIAGLLKEKGVIRSTTLFVWATYVSGLHEKLPTGKFQFSDPASLFVVLDRLATERPQRSVLISEGLSRVEIAELLASQDVVPEEEFLKATLSRTPYQYPFLKEIPEGENLEGFLFPDTYQFFEDTTAQEVVETMLANFEKKISTLQDKLQEGGHSLFDIITFASIIEKEVNKKADKSLVSSVLWNRLEADMPLQVDATLYYVTGRASHELTEDDLKLDSPYNTYKLTGLPKGPISNPGIEAIEAALYPKDSPYLFYLSDRYGVTYFARTFEEHKRNRAMYLQ